MTAFFAGIMKVQIVFVLMDIELGGEPNGI